VPSQTYRVRESRPRLWILGLRMARRSSGQFVAINHSEKSKRRRVTNGRKRYRNPVKYLLWSALILSVAASSQAAWEHHGSGQVPCRFLERRCVQLRETKSSVRSPIQRAITRSPMEPGFFRWRCWDSSRSEQRWSSLALVRE
jgi:hypothetical protein